MSEFISKWGALCGSIAAIIALFAVFIKPIKKWVSSSKAKKKDFKSKVLDGIKAIEDQIKSLTDDVAELQRDRLTEAHAFYMKQGWCPATTKTALNNWKKSYTAKGYNHLIDTYEKDIDGLPESPDAARRR